MNHLTNRLFILIISFQLMACSNEPQLDKKTKLLNTLQAMETAIETKSIDNFFEFVSDDFKSTQRGWEKKDAERLLRIRLMRNQNVHVHQAIKSIEWHENADQQAEVEVVVAVAGSEFSLSELPKIRADMVKFIVTFELMDDQYHVTETEWTRAHPADFVF